MVKNFRSGARPNEGTKGREHKTRLRAHVPCPRTDFDGVGQNLVVVDHFRVLHLQIFPTGAGHGDEVSVSAGHRAAPVFNDFDYYRSRVPRDGDGPAPATNEAPQDGIRNNAGVGGGNSCWIDFRPRARGYPRGHLSVVSVTARATRVGCRGNGLSFEH